jgi:hypothetical protein
MSFIVRAEGDLLKLLQPEGRLHPSRKPTVLVRVPGLRDSEATAWEVRLENLRQQCGCAAGAIALGAFAIGGVVYALLQNSLALVNPPLTAILLQSGLFLVGLILSALLGKLLGLSLARIRYQRACLELQERLRSLR